ncbi:MAG TPA: redoxin domain-containing protein [Planctomycetota bacterium]
MTMLMSLLLLVAQDEKTVKVGAQAPEFKVKDSAGKEINLTDLTKKGPVLVRLTCGCLGCDQEIGYFKTLQDTYKAQGLQTLAIFKEPDVKVEKYAADKQLNMLYSVDEKGASWKVWQTKTMPTNFLIAKGGQIVAIESGCDPKGLTAKKLTEKVAGLVEEPKK